MQARPTIYATEAERMFADQIRLDPVCQHSFLFLLSANRQTPRGADLWLSFRGGRSVHLVLVAELELREVLRLAVAHRRLAHVTTRRRRQKNAVLAPQTSRVG